MAHRGGRRRQRRANGPMNAEQMMAVEIEQFLDSSMHDRVTDTVGTKNQDWNYIAWLNAVDWIGDNILLPILPRSAFLDEEISTVTCYEQEKLTEKEDDLEQMLCNSMFWFGVVFHQLSVAYREIEDPWPWPIKNNIISTCDECVVLYGRDVDLDVPIHIWDRVCVGIRVVAVEEPDLRVPMADADDSE